MSRRAWFLAAVAASMAVVVLAAWAWTPDDAGATVTVTRRDLVLAVPISGVLQAEQSIELGPPQIDSIWNFKIAFMAPEGAEVRAGDPVLGFDTTDVVRELQEARAAAETAAQNFDKRQSELAREQRQETLLLAEARADARRAELKNAVPQDLVSGNEGQGARIDLAAAREQIVLRERRIVHLAASGEADLAVLAKTRQLAVDEVARATSQIAAMTVTAPRAGTVLYTTDWQGQKKKVGDSCWKAERVIEIPDLSRMRGQAEVDEIAAGRLRPGLPVVLRLDAHPNRSYAGAVRTIGKTVQPRSPFDPTKIVRLEIEFEETDAGRMRPGLRFAGSIELERLEAVLVIPLAAVEATTAGPVARLAGRWRSRRVTLELGRDDGELVEVRAGLREGDRVLVARELAAGALGDREGGEP